MESISKSDHAAIDDLNIHRDDEGKSLEKDLLLRVNNILDNQEEVQKLEPHRKQIIGMI